MEPSGVVVQVDGIAALETETEDGSKRENKGNLPLIETGLSIHKDLREGTTVRSIENAEHDAAEKQGGASAEETLGRKTRALGGKGKITFAVDTAKESPISTGESNVHERRSAIAEAKTRNTTEEALSGLPAS
ncbi:hypothetical protein TGME49_277800 [Toxoplasma gondii ME49]|uniref:Uncharacterized protein n=4 Tax=Toxoplasma gondii TaxID=5811 RepID=B6KRL2_TOXGV|nr:hypothetical protein TGME49_277800 [Toxoplasma gondii ME49]ESS28084.1 hypothetical protein TGVEG_277800 [Toxoplasma gondii VEG]KYF40532.1 hypothetical protein TGARI_277800 [Toxoplasma gondii ARI]PIL97334.1 hypothetical protein TGCOUG_277800 [Toxoplasma gondii COUG]EPT25379.1 hypothetical protein TGME49_277800 [Toxoplasma gondii ME49]CEL78827.1 TPA: hypothetical protein BN1205_028550 [Toxoplasma gondii VEG]|eukprot:XP_018635155.1 hypothetical protein TGME49_277800 [Toxoplasma gondii ME49]